MVNPFISDLELPLDFDQHIFETHHHLGEYFFHMFQASVPSNQKVEGFLLQEGCCPQRFVRVTRKNPCWIG